jgi:hypothetical protein
MYVLAPEVLALCDNDGGSYSLTCISKSEGEGRTESVMTVGYSLPADVFSLAMLCWELFRTNQFTDIDTVNAATINTVSKTIIAATDDDNDDDITTRERSKEEQLSLGSMKTTTTAAAEAVGPSSSLTDIVVVDSIGSINSNSEMYNNPFTGKDPTVALELVSIHAFILI